jgi:hypothetical protein
MTKNRKWHIMTGPPGTLQERPLCSGKMKNYRGIRQTELKKWAWQGICGRCEKILKSKVRLF